MLTAITVIIVFHYYSYDDWSDGREIGGCAWTGSRCHEENTAIDYFGKLLELGGYNYYGTERMYSGIYGCEMTASIFFGIVHYQRLRHMVSDKWQVANLNQHLIRRI